MTDFSHHLRNAAVGIYNERKKLLRHMLDMASLLEANKRPLKRLLMGRLTESIRGQMACIKRMDMHLERILRTLLEQAKERNNKRKEYDDGI